MNVYTMVRVCSIALVLGALYGTAADKTWLGVDGDWSNSANWSPSLPENGDNVIFGGSGRSRPICSPG